MSGFCRVEPLIGTNNPQRKFLRPNPQINWFLTHPLYFSLHPLCFSCKTIPQTHIVYHDNDGVARQYG